MEELHAYDHYQNMTETSGHRIMTQTV